MLFHFHFSFGMLPLFSQLLVFVDRCLFNAICFKLEHKTIYRQSKWQFVLSSPLYFYSLNVCFGIKDFITLLVWPCTPPFHFQCDTLVLLGASISPQQQEKPTAMAKKKNSESRKENNKQHRTIETTQKITIKSHKFLSRFLSTFVPFSK